MKTLFTILIAILLAPTAGFASQCPTGPGTRIADESIRVEPDECLTVEFDEKRWAGCADASVIVENICADEFRLANADEFNEWPAEFRCLYEDEDGNQRSETCGGLSPDEQARIFVPPPGQHGEYQVVAMQFVRVLKDGSDGDEISVQVEYTSEAIPSDDSGPALFRGGDSDTACSSTGSDSPGTFLIVTALLLSLFVLRREGPRS